MVLWYFLDSVYQSWFPQLLMHQQHELSSESFQTNGNGEVIRVWISWNMWREPVREPGAYIRRQFPPVESWWSHYQPLNLISNITSWSLWNFGSSNESNVFFRNLSHSLISGQYHPWTRLKSRNVTLSISLRTGRKKSESFDFTEATPPCCWVSFGETWWRCTTSPVRNIGHLSGLKNGSLSAWENKLMSGDFHGD